MARSGCPQKTGEIGSSAGRFPRRSVWVFLLVFGVLMALFYAFAIFTPFYKKYFLISYIPFSARLSGAILSFFGQNVSVSGAVISSPKCCFRVAPECSGVEPIALFSCAVLAFPAAFRKKIFGIIAGVLLLAGINFVRIITLFFIGAYFPDSLEVIHLDVWQALFIFFAVLFWILWLRWATRIRISTQ